MKEYYFTLGQGHKGFPGYVKVFAEDSSQARYTMFKKYGNKWCFQYDSLDKIHVLDKFEREVLNFKEEK